MLVTTILNNVVVDHREYDTMPVFAPGFTNIDTSKYKGKIEVGYIYDSTSGTFYVDTTPKPTPVPVPQEVIPTSEEMQMQILMNTELLVMYKEFGL